MDKSKIAVVGTGGCGNILLNELMNCDPRYTPIFCNTNLTEMEWLGHYKSRANSLYIANASGAGKDLELATDLIMDDYARIADFFGSKFGENSGISDFWIISSGAGASGNASVKIISKIIKTNNPDATVNLLIAAPSLNENGKAFSNFMNLSDDIAELYRMKILNSYMFIDNNKASNYKNMDEFNAEVMKTFDESLSISYNGVDFQDSKNANTAVGYKVILPLTGYNKNIGACIDYSIKTSNFVIPEGLNKCKYLCGDLDTSKYDKNYLDDNFTVEHDTKIAEVPVGDDFNFLVFGGCKSPNEFMSMANDVCEKYMAKEAEEEVFESFTRSRSSQPRTPSRAVQPRNTRTPRKPSGSRMSKEKLFSMMEKEGFFD